MKSKKDNILESATQLFMTHGFENTSVSAICEMANVSKGLIYHHFKSKDDILIALYKKTTQEMLQANNEETSIVPEKRVTQLVEEIINLLKTNKTWYQFNLSLMFQPTTKRILKQQIKERARLLFQSVHHIFKYIDSENSRLLTYTFIAEIDGIALSYLSSFENYPIDQMKNELLKKYTYDSKI